MQSKIHNYVILSPGRCASVFLAQYLIIQIAKRDNIEYKFRHFDRNFQSEYSNNKSVIHLHHIEDLSKYYNKEDYLIVIKRNPVEAAASNLIATKTQFFNANSLLKNKIPLNEYAAVFDNSEFEFNQNKFLVEVKRYLDWYINAAKIQTNLSLNFNQTIDSKYLNSIFDFDTIDDSDLVVRFSQPFDKWTKIKNSTKLKNLGENLFNEYKKQYPNIFASDDFIC